MNEQLALYDDYIEAFISGLHQDETIRELLDETHARKEALTVLRAIHDDKLMLSIVIAPMENNNEQKDV